jgi:hypothetical protein
MVQWLRLLRLWPRQEAGRRVEARCGHEDLRTLLSSGHGNRVHSHVPLSRVPVGRARGVGPAVRTGGGGRWSGQKSHHDLLRRCCSCRCVRRHDRYCSFYCGTWFGCHRRRCCRHWVARRHGRRWLGHWGRNIGVERRRGSRMPGTIHVNLLQEQIIANFEEVQK